MNRAIRIALANGQLFHVVAVLFRGKSLIRIAANSNKTHPEAVRNYNDGSSLYTMHAEMNVLRFAKPGDILYVMRVGNDGVARMAMPCRYCMAHIKVRGIARVTYTDANGQWQIL